MNGSFISTYNFNFSELLKVDLPRLVPSEIWGKMDKYRNNPDGMKRYFARSFKTKLETIISEDDSFFVSGEFDNETERVTIIGTRPAKLQKKHWDAYKFEVIITLMHEFVHAMQNQFRDGDYDLVLLHREHKDPDVQEEREYYASWGEIQAYAHCIYMEMKSRNSKKRCSEMLQHKTQYYSPTLRIIKRRFDGFDYPLRYLYREVLRWEQRYERFAAA